jgi:hypothetical protein
MFNHPRIFARLALGGALALSAWSGTQAASINDEGSKSAALGGAQAPKARMAAFTLAFGGGIVRSKAVAAYQHPSVGQHCFLPTAASGINVNLVVPVVSVDWSNSSGNSLLVFWRSSGFGCPGGYISVLTYDFNSGTTTLSDNVAFTLYVP